MSLNSNAADLRNSLSLVELVMKLNVCKNTDGLRSYGRSLTLSLRGCEIIIETRLENT